MARMIADPADKFQPGISCLDHDFRYQGPESSFISQLETFSLFNLGLEILHKNNEIFQARMQRVFCSKA